MSLYPNIRSMPSIISLGLFFFFSVVPNGYAQGSGYKIGPRDVLTLSISAGGELQQNVDLTVSSEGKINVPFVGLIMVAGFTVSETESIITPLLAVDYFVNPEINIHIKEYHSLQYYISGAVKSPGLYEMTTDTSLMELIAKAGGVIPERGNVAYLLRDAPTPLAENEEVARLAEKSNPVKVDLVKLLDKGDLSQNIILQSGDVVYIPLQQSLVQSELKIYLVGNVKNPGVYDFKLGMTALHACIMAGGFAKYAAPNRTKIIRKNGDEAEVIEINLNDVQNGKVSDVNLKPGDQIHVPETWL